MINKFKYQIDLAYPRSIDLTVMHGESIELNIDITINGEQWTSTSNTIEMLWQDPSMGDSWYTTTASRIGSTVTVDWKGTMDTGAELYRWFIRLKGPGDDQSYRVYGKFRMQKSPGFVPNQLPKPTNTLDFGTFMVINAPYYTKEYLDAELNSIKTTLTGHDKEIDELRNSITGGANESLRQHEENYNNPHRVKVEQLTEKSADAGSFKFEYSETENHPWGFTDFNFDPAMFNRGKVYLTALYNGTPLPFDAMVHRLDLPNFGNSLIFRSDEKYYISDGEYYIDWIFNNINSDDFTFALSINPNESFDDFAGWHVLVTNDTNPVENKEYKQGGIYKVLTEAMLRDEVTGIAYTLKVSNGELHLVEYREESFED